MLNQQQLKSTIQTLTVPTFTYDNDAYPPSNTYKME